MFRRWIIRGLALTLLTLCVVAWVGSYWRVVGISYNEATRSQSLFGAKGKARLLVSLPDGAMRRWRFYYNANAYSDHENARYHFMGFAFDRAGGQALGGLPGWPIWAVWVPLYFPTLLSALLLWFVWRKTRAKPIGGAFPVEPAKAEVK